ncbi:MAG TPA: hypothetical protein EYH34_03480 [Planctomycetes bacterium]|nr:hypothetical protein [Planctomycetota bacterium]
MDGPTDWMVFVGYLALVLVLGVWFARGQRTSDDYFVAGRRMNWFAVGVSLFATAFSSIAFVALPREAAYGDWHLLVTYLCIPLIITPVLWWLFVPIYRRLGLTSVYEYLAIRFCPAMRRLGTVLFAVYALGWMGTMVYATGLIIKAALGLDAAQFTWSLVGIGLFATLYTAVGGIRAVIWTDVLQAAVLGGGVVLVLLSAVGRVEGGWAAVFQMGLEHGKFRMFDMDPELTRRGTFWSACALGLFAYLPGYTTSQVTVQRYLCTPGVKEARRALVTNALVATVVAVLFFLAGSVLFAFYHQPGAGGFPSLEKKDQLMPYFVLAEMPYAGLSGLVLSGLFAAVMSTIDSGINSLTAVVAYDWLSGRRLRMAVNRLLTCAFGLCVIGAALVVPLLGEHVIDIIARVAGLSLGLLLGVYLMGMLVPRANSAGAWLGLGAGAGCLTWVWLATDVDAWWYGAFACLPVIAVGVPASYLARSPRPEQLAGLAWNPAREQVR